MLTRGINHDDAQRRKLGDSRRILQKYEGPTYLVRVDGDWSTPAERERDHSVIPVAETSTIENGGQFLPLDRPRELQELRLRFAGALWRRRAARLLCWRFRRRSSRKGCC